MSKKKAIVLLSGGLDSTTVLYYAMNKGYKVSCLIFDYGQRHKREVGIAKSIAKKAGCFYRVVKISLPWQGSSLLDKSVKLPQKLQKDKIPSTYVPARNIIFLGFAASFAEAIGAKEIFIGANAIDYSGYPDCRPEFFKVYQKVLEAGLKAGVKGKAIKIQVPLLKKTKAQIIKLGATLKVPYEKTFSCYKGGNNPCGKCDSCRLRARGFKGAGVKDPAIK